MSKLRYHHLKPSPGSSKSKLRKGRGESGKRGKTAGRGTKGTGARKTVPAYFEGGQDNDPGTDSGTMGFRSNRINGNASGTAVSEHA